MLRRRFRPSAVAWVLVLSAATTPMAQQIDKDPLNAIAWFVGGTWVGTVEGSNGTVEVRSKYEWTVGKKGIRLTIDKIEGVDTSHTHDGLFYWHPGRKELTMLQIENTGTITYAWAHVSADTLTFENLAVTSAGAAWRQRGTVIRTGTDSFDFVAAMLQDGVWNDVFTLKYIRQW